MIVNARMYSVTPAVKAAWRELFAWVLERARLDWTIIDHDFPAPLAALWARDDLGCAMMCGLPYSQREPRPTLIAALVPSPARYTGRPVYWSDIVVRADSPVRSTEQTFGGAVGYTVLDSMSGCVALRRHLRPYRSATRPRLYGKVVGDLIAGRRVIEALDAGTIDLGALDSYYHDLLRVHAPDLAAKVRVIATTEPTPIPPLVATGAVAPDQLQQLRNALAAVAAAPALAAQRELLLIRGFAFPTPADYAVFGPIARDAEQFASIW